ncbi:MAG: hypothetical protein O3C40_29490 [Planctomycetota bacterium]|nr:hypothetical protein [Planctomycetota bacterium]
MFRFRLSTLLVTFAGVGAALAAWVSYTNVEHSVTLVSQSEPVLTVKTRSERQSYEFSKAGTTHSLTVTFAEPYPSDIWPVIKWTFKVSDGAGHNWLCKGIAVRWEMLSLDDGFLKINDVFQGNTPYEVIPGSSYRIVKYWWVSNSSRTSITQNLHFYLIANHSNRILAEHRLTVIVNVVVPSRDVVVETAIPNEPDRDDLQQDKEAF